ncbi:MAG TPA: phosphotransferase family protein [Anaerolineae bacterium]|nr:phosphotransferase family protein [Anaerolineae bacterium]
MDTNWTDQPAAVRPGEELDTGRLEAYFHAHAPGLSGPIVVEQFPGGHSNLTYLLRVGERELVLRRPPFGAKIKTAHDMEREYRILSHLVIVYPRVPRPLLYCEDAAVLGAPFYVMERLKGVILRGSVPQGLQLTPSLMRGLSENLLDNLVEIHGVDYQAAGLGDLGRPAGYVQRQIEGWTKRYHDARTDDIPEMECVAAWLAQHTPPEAGASLIHNDYKYDNLVLDPQDLSRRRSPRIVGVLDWEMATVGDPLMDLGTTLGYWVEPDDPGEMRALSFGLTTLPGNLSRRELAQRYAERSGRDVSNILYYYVYALFKIAVIVQQIYARYKAGLTQDPRFAMMMYAVQTLGKAGALAIEKGRIDDLGSG